MARWRRLGATSRRQHAAGAIHQEDHILTQELAGVLAFAPLGAGEGEARARDSQGQQERS